MKKVLAFVLYKLTTLLGLLPFRTRSRLGWGLGHLLSKVLYREKRCAELQLERLVGVPHASAVAERVFASIGATLFESFALRRDLAHQGVTLELDDHGIIDATAAARQPLIALSGHVGNWELLAASMVLKKISVATIARPARSQILHSILERIRSDYGLRVIWRGGKATLREVVKELGDKSVVAVLLDQDIAGACEWIPFFGRPVRVPVAVVEAGKKVGATFVSAFAVRLTPDRFRLSVRSIPHNLSTREILTHYHSHLEAVIQEFPEQWVWFHKRWRSSMDGKRMSSAEYTVWLESLGEISGAPS